MKKVSAFLKSLFVGDNFYKSWLTIVTILFLWIFYEYSQNGRYQFAPNNCTHVIDTRTGETFDAKTGKTNSKLIEE